MSRYLVTFIIINMHFLFLLSSCGTVPPEKSVLRLKLTDKNAEAIRLQGNYIHADGLHTTQVEFDQRKVNDHLALTGAENADGKGETRLRYLDQPDPDSNQIIGPAVIEADYTTRQLTIRSIIPIDKVGRFQFDFAPQFSILALESSYQAPTKSLDAHLYRAGIGGELTMKMLLHKYFSLNLSGSMTRFSGDTRQSAAYAFLRLHPKTHFYIDIGRYEEQLDLGTDTNISYEQRVFCDRPCIDTPFGDPKCRLPCADNPTLYTYDGTNNSKLKLKLNGYRIGFGWIF